MKKLLLSLGALSAVVAPVAAVVACGSEDQTGVEKTTARGLLDYYHFDKKTEDSFKADIANAKSASEVDSIIDKIKTKGEPWKKTQDDLSGPKSTAHNLIDGFTLSGEVKTNYENKIKGAQSQKEIDTIVDEAREKGSANSVSDGLQEQKKWAADIINRELDLLPAVKAAALEEIENAKTVEEVHGVQPKYKLKTYEATVHVSVAHKGDFAVQADEIAQGQFVYFPKTAQVGDKVTWTDTSTPTSTKTVVYEVNALDAGGIVVDVTVDGKKLNTPAVVDTLRDGEMAIVLTDYTGIYLVKDVNTKEKFEDNAQIRKFLQTYSQKMGPAYEVIKWSELKNTFKLIDPGSELNTIEWSTPEGKYILSHRKQI